MRTTHRPKERQQMGIYKHKDRRGNSRIVLSKYWPGGEGRIRYYAPNMTAAKQLLSKIENAIFLGNWRDLRNELNGTIKKGESLKDFSERFFAVKVKSRLGMSSEKSYRKSINFLLDLFGDTPINKIGANELNRLIEVRKKSGMKGSTINQDLVAVKSLFSFAEEVGAIDHNPAQKIKWMRSQKKINYPLNTDELNRIIAAARSASQAGIVGLISETGIRVSECFRLKWQDIDFANKILTVSKSKNFECRSIPLSDPAIGYLRSQVRYVGIDWVWMKSRDARHINVCFLRDMCSRAGVAPIGYHDLRRYRSTQWHRLGLSIKEIAILLGHKDPSTTNRYLVIGPELLGRVKAVQTAEMVAISDKKQATAAGE